MILTICTGTKSMDKKNGKIDNVFLCNFDSDKHRFLILKYIQNWCSCTGHVSSYLPDPHSKRGTGALEGTGCRSCHHTFQLGEHYHPDAAKIIEIF